MTSNKDNDARLKKRFAFINSIVVVAFWDITCQKCTRLVKRASKRDKYIRVLRILWKKFCGSPFRGNDRYLHLVKMAGKRDKCLFYELIVFRTFAVWDIICHRYIRLANVQKWN